MNVRIGLAGAVLGVLAGVSVYACRHVRTVCAELLAREETAAQAVAFHAADTGTAIAALQETWERNGQSLQFWVAGTILSTLNQNMKRLMPLYENSSEALSTELEAVRADIMWIYEQEIMMF